MPNQEKLRLIEKGVYNWDCGDVGQWLEFSRFSDYKIAFIENCIAGPELLELQQEDLLSLGLTSLGHRKRMVRAIAQLAESEQYGGLIYKDNGSETQSDTGSVISDSSQSSAASSTASSVKSIDFSYTINDRIQCKVYYKKNVTVLSIKPASITLRDLKRKIRKQLKMRMEVLVKDSDGDLITVKRSKDLKSILRHTEPPLRLHCKRAKSSTSASNRKNKSKNITFEPSELQLLDSLMDATVMITSEGVLLAFNTAAERLFGYQRNEVLGQNVKVLMAAMYASKHDYYLRRYMKGESTANVVGNTRTVVARHANGTPLNVDLSVSKSQRGNETVFTGTLRPVECNKANQFQALDGLLEMAVVINDNGNILFMNKKSLAWFGHSNEDVLGQNIKMLMPSPYKDNHDYYLNNYKLTGLKKVIDKSRDVLAEKADGTIAKVNLSVSEAVQQDGLKTFTGIFRVNQAQQAREKPLLTRQREVIHSVLVPGILIDGQGTIQGFNRSASKLTGYEMEDVLGQNVNMLMPPKEAAEHDSYLKRYLDTGEKKIIGKERLVSVKTKIGRLIRVKLSVTEVVDNEKGKHYFTGMMHQ